MARRDEFLKRDTLSLFGDDSRSDCTVAEAKAFEKHQSKRRRRLAAFVVVPLVLIIVGGGIGYWMYEKAARAAMIEAENNKPLFNEKTSGLESAKFLMEIQGMDEEQIPIGPVNMVKQAFYTKPSEVRLKETYGGTDKNTPFDFKVIVNGKESVEVTNDAGEIVTVDFSDYNTEPALYAKAICQEWNSVYPDAQHPMVLKVPEKQEEEIQEPEVKFKDISLPTDPRTDK